MINLGYMNQTSLEDLLEVLTKNSFTAIHKGEEVKVGIIVHKSEKICGFMERDGRPYPYQCTTPLVLEEDGQVHVLNMSNGLVLYELDFERYDRELKNSPNMYDAIDKVIRDGCTIHF